MPEITIRRMTMDDVDGVYAVEISTFVDAWSRDAFVSDMKNPVARYLVAEQDGKIIGYGVVALANAKLHKTKRLIEVLRDFIAAANFQRRVCRTEVREVLQKPVRQAFSPRTRSSWSATTCRRLTRISRKPKRYLKNKQWRSSHDGRFFERSSLWRRFW